MTRTIQHVAAAIVAVLLTTASFAAVTAVPTEASSALVAPMLA